MRVYCVMHCEKNEGHFLHSIYKIKEKAEEKAKKENEKLEEIFKKDLQEDFNEWFTLEYLKEQEYFEVEDYEVIDD